MASSDPPGPRLRPHLPQGPDMLENGRVQVQHPQLGQPHRSRRSHQLRHRQPRADHPRGGLQRLLAQHQPARPRLPPARPQARPRRPRSQAGRDRQAPGSGHPRIVSVAICTPATNLSASGMRSALWLVAPSRPEEPATAVLAVQRSPAESSVCRAWCGRATMGEWRSSRIWHALAAGSAAVPGSPCGQHGFGQRAGYPGAWCLCRSHSGPKAWISRSLDTPGPRRTVVALAAARGGRSPPGRCGHADEEQIHVCEQPGQVLAPGAELDEVLGDQVISCPGQRGQALVKLAVPPLGARRTGLTRTAHGAPCDRGRSKCPRPRFDITPAKQQETPPPG